jgi:hypothetical protein
MGATMRRWIIVAVAALGFFCNFTTAEEIPYRWDGVSRIVAIGDIHGAYDNLVAVLQEAHLVNRKLEWCGGRTHLVQTGDMMDRGPQSRKVMDLFMRLEKEARRAGGRVHVLIGNHEAMNVVGILDETSPAEFASFVDRNSERRREQVYELNFEKQKEKAVSLHERPPDEEKARKEFDAKYPLGYVEHVLAFRPDGYYGRWILSHNVAVLINGILFSHADWSEKMAALGIQEVNRRVRLELSGQVPLENGVTFDPESPLQYRGFSKGPLDRDFQALNQARLDGILQTLDAKRIVVGHTVTRSGAIEPRFQGKHLSIDTGMLDIYGGGHRVALGIEGDRFLAIHPLGSVEIPSSTDSMSLTDYLAAVATVDPQNVGVHVALVDRYRLEGNLGAARSSFEELFQNHQTIPDNYDQAVCILYQLIGVEDGRPLAWVEKHCSA